MLNIRHSISILSIESMRNLVGATEILRILKYWKYWIKVEHLPLSPKPRLFWWFLNNYNIFYDIIMILSSWTVLIFVLLLMTANRRALPFAVEAPEVRWPSSDISPLSTMSTRGQGSGSWMMILVTIILVEMVMITTSSSIPESVCWVQVLLLMRQKVLRWGMMIKTHSDHKDHVRVKGIIIIKGVGPGWFGKSSSPLFGGNRPQVNLSLWSWWWS